MPWYIKWLTIALIPLLACSGKTPSPEEENPTQLFEATAVQGLSVDTPEHTLFEQATRFYNTGLYPEAAEVFGLLKEGYPFGPYAEFAEIKIADCEFENRSFITAAQLYEDFIKQNPSSTSLDYAMLRQGESYKLTNKGVGRDNAPLIKALEIFDGVLARFPNSRFRPAVEELRADVQSQLYQHEQLVINFYKRQGNEKASKNREELLASKWGEGDFSHVSTEPEPLTPQIVKASLRPSELETPALVKLDRFSGERPKPQDSTFLVANDIQSEVPLPPRDSVLELDCRQDSTQAYFLLDEPLTDNELKIVRESLELKGEALAFRLGNRSLQPRQLDCFGTKDVTVGENGIITLQSSQLAEPFTLLNPPRLVLAFH